MDNQPQQTPPQPVPQTPAAASTVTISQAEYDALRNSAAPVPTPAVSYNTTVLSGELPKSAVSKDDKIWFAVGLTVLVSLLVPGGFGFVFAVPIFLFAILAAKGIFKDTSDRPAALKGVVLLFKVLAIVAGVIFTGIAAIIIFFMVLFGAGGGHMD